MQSVPPISPSPPCGSWAFSFFFFFLILQSGKYLEGCSNKIVHSSFILLTILSYFHTTTSKRFFFFNNNIFCKESYIYHFHQKFLIFTVIIQLKLVIKFITNFVQKWTIDLMFKAIESGNTWQISQKPTPWSTPFRVDVINVWSLTSSIY